MQSQIRIAPKIIGFLKPKYVIYLEKLFSILFFQTKYNTFALNKTQNK